MERKSTNQDYKVAFVKASLNKEVDGIEELERKVRDDLSFGWQLQGGINVYQLPDRDITMFTQSLSKDNDDCECEFVEEEETNGCH